MTHMPAHTHTHTHRGERQLSSSVWRVECVALNFAAFVLRLKALSLFYMRLSLATAHSHTHTHSVHRTAAILLAFLQEVLVAEQRLQTFSRVCGKCHCSLCMCMCVCRFEYQYLRVPAAVFLSLPLSLPLAYCLHTFLHKS